MLVLIYILGRFSPCCFFTLPNIFSVLFLLKCPYTSHTGASRMSNSEGIELFLGWQVSAPLPGRCVTVLVCEPVCLCVCIHVCLCLLCPASLFAGEDAVGSPVAHSGDPMGSWGSWSRCLGQVATVESCRPVISSIELLIDIVVTLSKQLCDNFCIWYHFPKTQF